MRKLSIVLNAAVLVSVTASPALSQADAWQRKWYWGAQGGTVLFKTPTTLNTEIAYDVGAHWLITGKRSALYVGFDQLFFPGGSTSAVFDASASGGVRLVDFTKGQRIQ